jgi:CRP-like cAMP-binding protein
MAMDHNRRSLRLAPEARVALVKYGARASWPAGFTVYERGSAADGLFVVLAGRIVLRSRVKAGRGFVPAVAASGETFGAEGSSRAPATSPTRAPRRRARRST